MDKYYYFLHNDFRQKQIYCFARWMPQHILHLYKEVYPKVPASCIRRIYTIHQIAALHYGYNVEWNFDWPKQ
jgi:hypothetical protein